MKEAKNSAADRDPVLRIDTLEIFKGIEPRTLDQIKHKIQRRNLGPGELLFNAGDASDALFIVANGRMRIWTVSAAGAEVTLNVLTVGAVFGEIGMLDGSVRTAGASAMLPTQLIGIARRSFFDALDHDPKLARNVIDLLCKRLRWTSARMEDASLRPAPQRLARMLVHLAQDHCKKTPHGIEIVVKLTQGELAQWTAMSRESMNRLLKRWVEEGVLSQYRGIITLHELARLEEIAEIGE
jgi:CRP/FNR family transcriptional regulator, cyclic AMP receptor protein